MQNEIAKNAPLYGTVAITPTGTSGYQKITLPADYFSIYQLLDSDYIPQTDFRVVGQDIYVPFNLTGSLIYRKIPTTITALSATAEFDDSIMTTILPNGLASKLLLTENVTLANYFGQVYEEMLADLKRKNPQGITNKTDVYDSTFIGV